jgi:tyrosine decarboxylase/aspartate 1-decarboxylase
VRRPDLDLDRSTVTSALTVSWDAAAIADRLRELELLSNFDRYVQNLFDEGPHLVNTPETPWGDEARALAIDAYVRFIYGENWIGGEGYRVMEREIAAWLGTRFDHPDASGLMTASGSESNLVALLAARERGGGSGSIVLPAYSHYSVFKACRLFDLEPITVDAVDAFHTVEPEAIEAAIRPDTVGIYAAAGTFGTGWIDPIEQIAAIAHERGLAFHVDGCCGGFVLPFLSGEHAAGLPSWSFANPGVSSISVDFHKNGLTPPPASMVLFRDPADLARTREVSPPQGGMLGTRAAGPVAAAWAMIQALGVDGYTAATACSMRLRDELRAVLESHEDLSIVPGSHLNFITFYSETLDLQPVWTEMRDRGWTICYGTTPVAPSLVLWTLPQNHGCTERFAADLADAMRDAPARPTEPADTSQPAWLVTPYGGLED